jgi:DNA invertase Pin-like site-specific DNA recombinase
MLIGYARTSTADQEAGLAAQDRDLAAVGCEKIFAEDASAAGPRAGLDQALDFVRAGDTLVVTKLDRLARSTGHLLEIVRTLEDKDVALRILDFGGEAVNTSGPTGRLLLTVFAAFAQFEREMMLERQREGIARARAQGKYRGRKPTARARAGEVRALRAEGLGATEIARRLGIGRASVYRILAGMRDSEYSPDST